MSAEASIIFEFHLHCTKIELERLFFSKWSFYGTDKNCRKLCKGEKTGGYKGGLEIRVSGQGELKMVQ